MVLSLESVRRTQGSVTQDEEKSSHVFIVLSGKFPVSSGLSRPGPPFHNTCALVPSVTVAPCPWPWGLSSDSCLLQSWASSLWGFQLSMDCMIFSTSIPMLDEVGKYSYCG